MQPDPMIIQVDLANTGTTTEVSLSRYEELPNKTTYILANHTPGSRDQVAFSRSFPTKVGNFKGVGKTSVKSTRDVSVEGVDSTTSVASAIIVETNFSIPVGASPAAIKAARQQQLALLDDDSIMDRLNIQLGI